MMLASCWSAAAAAVKFLGEHSRGVCRSFRFGRPSLPHAASFKAGCSLLGPLLAGVGFSVSALFFDFLALGPTKSLETAGDPSAA